MEKMSPSSMMIPAERREYIMQLAGQQRIIKISPLSRELGVSEITIRRDLEKLEDEGLLERTHGGAIFNRHLQGEPLYSQKDKLQPDIKKMISRAACDLIQEGDTVFIHSGSTTRQMFPHLNHFRDLRVITSNASAILELNGLPLNFDLISVGGSYRWQSNSFVGPFALATIRQAHATKTFLGVDGVSIRYGLTTPNQYEAEVAKAMLEQTHGQLIVVADHTKIGVVADFVTCRLDAASILVTDEQLDEDYYQALTKMGLEIIIPKKESPDGA
jgi:DeoR family transcriptional regulator, fructose operon transcriptional repressor